MRTICVASGKGGSGKTTITIALAVEAEARGERVAVMDFDPQGSLSEWWECREGETPGYIQQPESIPKAIREAAKDGYTLVIIDTTPKDLELIHAAMRACDLVLIPTKPSPLDIWAVEWAANRAEKDNRPFMFVINEAPSQGTSVAQMAYVLASKGHVAETVVKLRIPYRRAVLTGEVGNEIDAAAGKEIAELWREVEACLPKKGRL